MCAFPTRASSGPSSSTEPRSRPTRVRSGAWVRDLLVRTLIVVVPMPSTSAPMSASRRAITSTSPMRGTLVSTHSSSVSRQAASSGSAAFLLPSTATRPSSRWPPSMRSVDISSALPADSPRPPRSPAANPRNTGSGRRRTPKVSSTRRATRAGKTHARRRRVAPSRVTMRQRVLRGEPDGAVAVAAGEAGALDQPRRRHLHRPAGCANAGARRAGARRDPLAAPR